MSWADHTSRSSCSRCTSVSKCVPECARTATGLWAWPWGCFAQGFLVGGSGARVPGGTHPGPCANACGAGSVCLCVAAAIGTIFCFGRDRNLKGKAAAACRVLFPSDALCCRFIITVRAAPPLPAALAGRRAVQRPGRLHAWRAPKPPPPPPYLSEKQPHVEAEKPAGGGRGRPGV